MMSPSSTPAAASTARSRRSLSGMVSSKVGSDSSRGRKLRSLPKVMPACSSWDFRFSKMAISSGELRSAIFMRLR